MVRDKISPVSFGLLIFMVCLCAAAVIFVKDFMPYREYLKIMSVCTGETPGTIVENEQVQEGIYYYGPKVEYFGQELGAAVHTDVISTVKFSNSKLEPGTKVTLRYDPGDYSFVMLKDDKTAKNNYMRSGIIAAVLISLGAATLVVSILRQFVRTRPVKYDSAPDGSSFEEWQKTMQLKEQAAQDEKEDENVSEIEKQE